MPETQSLDHISPSFARIAQRAKDSPQMAFTSLNHLLSQDLLMEAFKRTRQDAATGVDGVTGQDYEADLKSNLQDLLNRAKSGTYKAPPVRRVTIPKGEGTTRALGIPTFEDKVLQRAVTMILEVIYEQDFLDFSYGFRPGRSAHDAVEATRDHLRRMRGTWVIEVDIQDFFGSLDHARLREFLDARITDGVLRRLIHKWLKAGVMDAGQWQRGTQGTPQGGVISPLLGNIYLHEVFDRWFVDAVQPRLRGRSIATRYADDIVMGFERREDAQRVLDVLSKRFGKYGLTLHPDKTRMYYFAPPDEEPPAEDAEDGGQEVVRGAVTHLGFTLYWGRSRKGRWVIKRKTAKSRLSRAVKAIGEWCKRHRHWSIAEQHRALCHKVRGHMSYFGVTGNMRALTAFVREAERRWKQWLGKRGGRSQMDWEDFQRFKAVYALPTPRIVHRRGT